MALGRRRSEWRQTAAIIAWLAACHGVRVDERKINPFHEDGRPEPRLLVPIQALKRMFVKDETKAKKRTGQT